MLEFREQCFIVHFLSTQINNLITANTQSLADEDRFYDLKGIRQLLDNLYYLHSRAEDTKAYHMSAEDAREALTAYHNELRLKIQQEFKEACVARYNNNVLINKIFG